MEDAGLFRSSDGGRQWQELPGLRCHRSGPSWQPGAGGMCLHTIILDPHQPGRMFTAISAAGAFRSDDEGETWRPVNHGLVGEAAARGGVREPSRMASMRPNSTFAATRWSRGSRTQPWPHGSY